MADLNSGAWGGRVINTPRLKTGENGLKVVWFMLACQRFIKDPDKDTGWREHTDRFPVIAWGYLAERVNKANFETGTYINITGRLQTYDYERKLETSDGVEFTVPSTGFEIALDTFTLLPAPKGSKARTNHDTHKDKFVPNSVKGNNGDPDEEKLGENLPF